MIRYETRDRREIMPDLGIQGRRKNSDKFKRFLYQARFRTCHYCNLIVAINDFEVVHIEAVSLRGNDKMSNKAVAHPDCHREHTREENPIIARCDRIGRKHKGHQKRATMPCGRDSGWKRKLDGTTVKR